MDRQRELIYEEIKRSSDKVIDLINSYDRRINYVFIMATTLLGILMLFIMFVTNLYTNIKTEVNPLEGAIPFVIVIMVVFFIICIIGLYATLLPCIEALKTQRLFHVVETNKLIKKFKEGIKSENELIDLVIEKNNKVFQLNVERVEFVIEKYESALLNLRTGVIGFVGFSILSFILLFVSSISGPGS